MRRLSLLACTVLLLGGCAGQVSNPVAEPSPEPADPAAGTTPAAFRPTTLTVDQQLLLQDLGMEPGSSQATEVLDLGRAICIQSGTATTQVMAMVLRPQTEEQRALAGTVIKRLCPRADLDDVLSGASPSHESSGATPSAQPSKSAVRPSTNVTSDPYSGTRSGGSKSSSSSSTTSSQGGRASFDKEWANTCAGRIVEDIGILDQRLGEGRISGSGLMMLARSYRCLSDVGTPPGVDAAKFYSLYSTCADFSDRAGDETYSDPMRAEARYVTVKNKTPELLAMISKGTGKRYSLG